MVGADRRAEIGEHLSVRLTEPLAQCPYRTLDHAGRKTAPACVHGGDAASLSVGQQHRHAVRHHDGRYDLRAIGDRGIGLRAAGDCRRLRRIDDSGAVHLFQPGGIGRQQRTQAHPILVDRGSIVAGAASDVHAAAALGSGVRPG